VTNLIVSRLANQARSIVRAHGVPGNENYGFERASTVRGTPQFVVGPSRTSFTTSINYCPLKGSFGPRDGLGSNGDTLARSLIFSPFNQTNHKPAWIPIPNHRRSLFPDLLRIPQPDSRNRHQIKSSTTRHSRSSNRTYPEVVQLIVHDLEGCCSLPGTRKTPVRRPWRSLRKPWVFRFLVSPSIRQLPNLLNHRFKQRD
jgi:hypothetical protein